MRIQGFIRCLPIKTTTPDRKLPCPLDKLKRQFRVSALDDRLSVSGSPKSIEALINAHDPRAHPGALLDQILDHLFTQISRRNPTIMRKLYQIAIDNGDHPLEFVQAADPLFPKLLLAIARDETGLFFKQLSIEEITLVARGLRGLVMFPLMEKNRVFGTSAHLELTKPYLRKMLLNEG